MYATIAAIYIQKKQTKQNHQTAYLLFFCSFSSALTILGAILAGLFPSAVSSIP